jgi:choline-sulfatase
MSSFERPDLVLIITDQQRFDQLGYASDGHFETPNLDALAKSGVIFDAAYSASTTCVPARMSMLTGIQPHRLPTQENRNALREGFWTVAHELRRGGYETAAIGKMHFAPVHARHGFETMRLCEHLHAQGLSEVSEQRGDLVDDYHDWLVANGLDDWRLAGDDRPVPSARPAEIHPTAWVEREVLEFLAGRDRSDPLFLVVSFPHPHAPYDPPEPYASMYDPADSVLPVNGQTSNAGLPMVFGIATMHSSTRSEAENSRALRSFLATVRGLVKQIDDAVGRIVESLDLSSTVVLFASDHGDFAGHRGLMRKNPWVPFDDLARVPFFVSGAGVDGGRVSSDLVQTSDIALTCLDYAGVTPTVDLDFDSRSLRPLLDTRAVDPDRIVYSAISMGWPMARQGKYKLITHHDAPARVLFDLSSDPDEQVNLALDPAFHGVRDALYEPLERMIRAPIIDPAVGAFDPA